MDAHYEAKLVEEVEGMKEELTERVDSYLEYVADEWLQENALQVAVSYTHLTLPTKRIV